MMMKLGRSVLLNRSLAGLMGIVFLLGNIQTIEAVVPLPVDGIRWVKERIACFKEMIREENQFGKKQSEKVDYVVLLPKQQESNSFTNSVLLARRADGRVYLNRQDEKSVVKCKTRYLQRLLKTNFFAMFGFRDNNKLRKEKALDFLKSGELSEENKNEYWKYEQKKWVDITFNKGFESEEFKDVMKKPLKNETYLNIDKSDPKTRFRLFVTTLTEFQDYNIYNHNQRTDALKQFKFNLKMKEIAVTMPAFHSSNGVDVSGTYVFVQNGECLYPNEEQRGWGAKLWYMPEVNMWALRIKVGQEETKTFLSTGVMNKREAMQTIALDSWQSRN